MSNAVRFTLTIFLSLYFLIDMSSSLKRVVVIGGGAAGYFSSIECANVLAFYKKKTEYEVIVLEAGRTPLQKVLISGGGRCNVMHDSAKGAKEILKGYPRGNKELTGPFMSRFGPKETREWFEGHGVRLKVEADGRTFPVTDRSSTVSGALQEAASAAGVQVRCLTRVVDVLVNDELGSGDLAAPSTTELQTNLGSLPKFTVRYTEPTRAIDLTARNTGVRPTTDVDDDETAVATTTRQIECHKVIFATGSNRAGYSILGKLGHTLVEPVPSLFSFKIKDKSLTDLAGVSCKFCEVKLVVPKGMSAGPHRDLIRPNVVPTLQQSGPLLITHQGISGPAVLRLSSFGARVLSALNYRFDISVNWLPALDTPTLTELLWLERTRHLNKQVGTSFPSTVAEEVVSLGSSDQPPSSYVFHEEGGGVRPGVGVGAGGVEDDTGPVITRRLWGYLLQRAGVPATNRWDQISKADVTRIATQLRGSVFSASGRGLYRDEFVTCGGVALNEVHFDSMESKRVPGLYLAGEVLNIDGVTGGYNFQSAWSAGWIAGHQCGRRLCDENEKIAQAN